jgi:hypothetical protein
MTDEVAIVPAPPGYFVLWFNEDIVFRWPVIAFRVEAPDRERDREKAEYTGDVWPITTCPHMNQHWASGSYADNHSIGRDMALLCPDGKLQRCGVVESVYDYEAWLVERRAEIE